MSLFGSPEEHAANGPDTWQIVRAGERCWHVTDARGNTISYHATRRDAEAEIAGGFTRQLYDDEARWYAGAPVRNWRPWAELAS